MGTHNFHITAGQQTTICVINWVVRDTLQAEDETSNCGQTDRQTDRRTDRQTDRQIDTDRQKCYTLY